MRRPLERLKPIGFWSYARQDDTASAGQLSDLRFQVAAQLQLIYGKSEIRIFQDVAAIAPGDEWERAIDDAIEKSTFFIPILTPAFVESEWCCKEVAKFLEREAAINAAHPELQGRRRIFPIRYIKSSLAEPYNADVIDALSKLLETDFKPLRREREQSQHTRDQIMTLADALNELLQVRVERPPTPEEATEEQRRRETAAAEAARQAKAASEQRSVAEAAQLAEEQRKRDAAAAEDALRAEQARQAQATAEAERQATEARRIAEAEARKARAAERSAGQAAFLTQLSARAWPWLAGLGAIVIAVLLLTHDWSTPAPIPAARPSDMPTADAVPAPSPAPSESPAVAEAVGPTWIAGTWQRIGASDGCVIRIALSATTLSFGRTDNGKSVDQPFTIDPASPTILLTPGNRYELLGSGDILITPRKGDSESRLHKCA